ncbi:MAG TPA: RHS repeat protein, partial [Gammaproteobacteria bacterium]|nr:RHS repeat protein [Gammaproteobacteria bacterium]
MDIKALGKILGFSLVVFGGWGGTASADEIPDYYSEAGFNVNRDYQNQLESEYIDPFSGTLNLHYTDLFIPGNGGMDLKIQRSYSNIHDAQAAALGRRSTTGLGWTIHFGRVSKNDADFCSRVFLTDVLDNPVLELPDGSKQIMADAMTANKSYLYITQNRWKANCKNYTNSSGTVSGLEVWSPDGTKYDMAWLHTGIDYAELYPTRITDKNGNFIDIQYETVPSSGVTLITGVITSDGRNVTFSYADRTNNRVRLASISANGQTWTYGYREESGVIGDYYYLTSVTRPDGLRWDYDYKTSSGAGQYSISKVRYPYGGSMSYTYGYNSFGPAGDTLQTTSVTRKTGGGGSWTYRYRPGSSSDTTVITAPDATYTYKHFGARAANAGTLWKVGLLLEKRIGNVQTETYTWDSQPLSHENYRRPKRVLGLAWDNGYSAPILTRKSITRDGTRYTTTYSGHDEYGNPTSVSETGNDTRNTALTYDIKTNKWLLNLVSREVTSGVGTISRSYDANGNLTRQNKFGSTESYTYTSQGDVSSYTDSGNKQTRYSSYKRGIAQTENQPEGVSISRNVNNTGTIASVTNGRTTSYRYDKMNRLSAISYPTNAGVTIRHSGSGRTVSRGGYRQVVSYDGFGRPTRYVTTGGDSVTVNIRYDAVGRKTFESYPSSSSGITYTPDALGRVKSESHSGGGTRSFSYSSGNTVTDNDLRGFSTTYTYRSYGNPDEKYLLNIRSPEGINTRIDRNKLGLITRVSQGGKTRNYSYNSRFHLTSIRNPETGTTTYGRDNAGNMTSKRVGSSGATSYTYDGQHRLTTINYPAGTPDVAITYNTRNKITSVNNGTARRVFDYDSNDNISRETLSIDGKTFSINYDISSLDHISSMTYPSGRRLSLSPNALGRPTQAGTFVSSVSYFANGQPQSIRYGNGLTTTLG